MNSNLRGVIDLEDIAEQLSVKAFSANFHSGNIIVQKYRLKFRSKCYE